MNLFHRYENLLIEKNYAAAGKLAPGIDKAQILEKINALYPSLLVDDDFCALYEWHNGSVGDDKHYLSKTIIPDFFPVSLDEAIWLVQNDDIYHWKENGYIPLFTEDDGYLCIQPQKGGLNATRCPIFYFATWDADFHRGMQKYDSLNALFETNLRCLSQGIIYPDEQGNLDMENNWDEYHQMGRIANPRSPYWES